MKVESRPRIYGRWFLRVLLGLVVLLTSLGKAMDPEGFQKVLGEYQALPEWALFPTAALIINLEFAIAIWLLIGWRMREAALTAAGTHLLYACFTGAAVIRGLKLANSGWLGAFLPLPLSWLSPLVNLVALSLSLFLWWLAPRPRAE